MNPKIIVPGLLMVTALSAQVMPDTFQRITSTASPGVSYDIGVAGADGSFSIVKTGAGRRLTIDANGHITVLNNLTVNGTFTANNFAGGALTGGATGLSLNAGGANQNVTLTPSGTGHTILNGNVGIGTATPASPLHIVTADSAGFTVQTTGLDSQSRFVLSNDARSWQFRVDGGNADSLIIRDSTAGQDRFAVTAAGNFGIGINTPGSKLHVQSNNAGGEASGMILQNGSLAANTALRSIVALTDSYQSNTNGRFDTLVTRQADGSLNVNYLLSPGSGGTPGSRLYLAGSTGNVGIGTTAPAAKLDVAGTLKVSGDATFGGTLGIGLGGAAPSATLDVASDIRVRGDLYVDGVIHVASGNVQAATSIDAITITSTTDSSGYATGALIVSGGAGIAKSLHVGQNLTAGGTVNASAVQVGGQNVWHAGNFNPANYLQQAGGVVSGGTSGLVINAGAADQNLILDADGTGRVEVRDTLAVTNSTGAQYLLMGNQDAAGANNPAILRAIDGKFEFGRGNAWTGQGGTFTSSVTLANNGNVGIGTAAPDKKLTVFGSSPTDTFGAQLRLHGTETTGAANTGGAVYFSGHDGSAERGWGYIRGMKENGTSGNSGSYLSFGTRANGGSSLSERVRITSAGRVGIGTTSPAQPLHVNGAVALGSNSDYWRLNPTGGNLELGIVGTTANRAVSIVNPDATGQAHLYVEGNVGIGTTSPGDKLEIVDGDNGGANTVHVSGGRNAGYAGGILFKNSHWSAGDYGAAAIRAVDTGSQGGHLAFSTTAISSGATGVPTERVRITPDGSVGVGTALPFMKMQVNDGGLAVTGAAGGVLHLADGYSDGAWGVRVAGIDNSSNGHDLAVLTRTTPTGPFVRAFTVKSDGTTGVLGNLKFFSPTGDQWGFVNQGGVLSLFRASVTGDAQTPVAVFTPDRNVAFTGRISVAAPSGTADAATKGYVDETNPWSQVFGNVSLKDRNDWLGLGISSPAAPLHVQTSAPFGEVARFGGGGDFWDMNVRSYITLQKQNPDYWWELSVQNEAGGGGGDNGFALRAKHADDSVSKPRLYIGQGAPVPAAHRSYMRLYNQNVALGWEFSIEDPGGGGGHNGFALREYRHGLTAVPALYIEEATGRVGLGTTNPLGFRLAVNGSIRAKEVVVTNDGWPDYVFSDDYELASLEQVEAHIKEKKHLPGVPSAREVGERGVSLGEMQSTLLAKVEELTLHLIAQQKEIAALRDQVAALQSARNP